MAVAGLLGRSLFPTMRKRGYDTQFSAGTILAGASLDPIIPPSVLAVIIATLADVSAGKMLIAGILPGLLLTGMFLVYVVIRVRITPSLAPDVAADAADRKTQGSVLMALARMLPVGLRVLHGDGPDHARRRHPDRGGRDRRGGRAHARGLSIAGCRGRC